MWPYQNRQVAKLDSSMKNEEDRNGTNDEKEVHHQPPPGPSVLHKRSGPRLSTVRS